MLDYCRFLVKQTARIDGNRSILVLAAGAKRSSTKLRKMLMHKAFREAYKKKTLTLQQQRLWVLAWVGEAYDKLHTPEYERMRNAAWTRTGSGMTANGEADADLQPEGLDKYVPPPLDAPLDAEAMPERDLPYDSSDEDGTDIDTEGTSDEGNSSSSSDSSSESSDSSSSDSS